MPIDRTPPDRARCVIVGGGVAGTAIAYYLAELGWSDVVLLDRKELTSGSTFHSAGPRRPAALVGLADADDDGLGRALPEARRRRVRPRLDRVRRHPARVHAGALGGDAPPGGLGQDLRAAARADLARGGARALPADVDRQGHRRLVAADRRLPRSQPAHLRHGRRRAARRLPGPDQHARDRHRRQGRRGDRRADRARRHRVRGRGQRRRHVRGRDRAPGRRAHPDRPDGARVRRHAAVPRARRPHRHDARPRPPRLLPRGGRRAGVGRLRAPQRAVGAARRAAAGWTRSRPTSTAACSRRTGTASRRSSTSRACACRCSTRSGSPA